MSVLTFTECRIPVFTDLIKKIECLNCVFKSLLTVMYLENKLCFSLVIMYPPTYRINMSSYHTMLSNRSSHSVIGQTYLFLLKENKCVHDILYAITILVILIKSLTFYYFWKGITPLASRQQVRHTEIFCWYCIYCFIDSCQTAGPRFLCGPYHAKFTYSAFNEVIIFVLTLLRWNIQLRILVASNLCSHTKWPLLQFNTIAIDVVRLIMIYPYHR